MNKTENKLNAKTILTFLTALMLTFVMVFAIACNKNGESTSESTSESQSESESEEKKTDEQTLKNGDFEFTSSSSFPATPSSWSYTTDGSPYSTTSTSSRGMIDTEETAYNKLATDHKATENPGTPYSKGKIQDDEDSKADEKGTKILMLHSTKYTAHYYTSSTSLKLSAGQYGKLSVWVRTDNIETVLGAKSGAYIKVKNNVVKEDSATYDPLMIENIDTNGEWTNYVIYLAPNQTKATTFTVVLGLGQGNKYNTEKLCNGFAYFDNITFDYVSQSEYDQNVTPTTVITKSAKTVDEDFKVDASENITPLTVNLTLAEGNVNPMVVNGSGEFNKVNVNNPNGGYEIVNKGTAGLAQSATTVDGNEFDNGIYMDFSELKNIGSSYTFTTESYTLYAESYTRISFWAKISARSSDVKATMALYNVVNGEIYGSPVASFDNVSTEDYENELNGDFARYTFYIANNFPTKDFNYAFKFSFGPSDRKDVTDIKTLPIGYAIFKDFEIEQLTKENYDIADTSSDTRAKKATLTGEYASDYVEDEDEEESETKDSYSITVGYNASLIMEQTGFVSLDDLSSVSLYTPDSDKTTVGVVNSKYVSLGNALYDANLTAALNALKGKIQGDNKDIQALLVKNTGNEQVYVAANSITVAANTTYVFSIKVYAHGDAKAFVSLVNMGDAYVTEKSIMNFDIKGNYDMTVEVQNSDCAFLDGYAQVTFIVTAGNDPLNLRLEFGLNNAGIALFDSISSGNSSSSYTSADAVKNVFEDDFIFATTESYKQAKIYYYENETDAKADKNRLKDDDGNDRYDVGETYDVATFGTLEGKTAKLVQYYRFDTADRYVIEAQETEEEITSESTDESDPNADNVQKQGWLQVVSIIIALAVIAALVAVIVRKSFAKKSSKKNKTKTYYHQGYNKNNRYSKTRDVAVPDEEDNSKEYDYDNPDNN